SESDIGDTALYDPRLKAIVHYKGQRFFLINVAGQGFDGVTQFATGVKGQPGREGTWRDAEDGALEGHPIAQGSVDSTIGVFLEVPPNGEATFYYWISVGRSHREVRLLDQLVREKTASRLIERTAAYWKEWVNCKDIDFGELPPAIVSLY